MGLLLLALPTPALAQLSCAEDPSLDAAATDLLARPDRPDADDLVRAARAAGSDVPTLAATLLGRDPDARENALRRGRERFGSLLRCGEASQRGRTLLLVAPDTGALRPLGPRPRASEPDERAIEGVRVAIDPGPETSERFEVWLAPGYTDARLYARDAGGHVFETATRAGDAFEVPADLARPLVLQLLARGPSGPIPVAERSLGALEPSPPGPPSSVPITDRVAALRRAAGARELRHNGLLARAAQAHAEEICRLGRVVHRTEAGDPEERLARAGIRARHVGETASRASDLDSAYRRTRESPSHHAGLTDRRFTDVGVGVHQAEGGVCLVVVLAAWPRAVPPSAR